MITDRYFTLLKEMKEDPQAFTKYALMLEQERTELLATCRAQHEAMETLVIKLINVTRDCTCSGCEPFMPTRSEIWPAFVTGNTVLRKTREFL